MQAFEDCFLCLHVDSDGTWESRSTWGLSEALGSLVLSVGCQELLLGIRTQKALDATCWIFLNLW